MATPNPFAIETLPTDFMTPIAIIRRALQDAGKLRRGDTPDSEELVDCVARLNEVLLMTQTQGTPLWLEQIVNVPLVAGKATYVLSPTGDVQINRPTRCTQGYYLDNFGNQRPLILLSWDDWNRLSNKNQPGSINSFFVDKQAFALNVTMWLVPDTTAASFGSVQLLTFQQQPLVTNVTQQMVFPPEWGAFLHWGLASELATGQPQSVQQRCDLKAAAAFKLLTEWTVEDASVTLAPDVRTLSRFGAWSA